MRGPNFFMDINFWNETIFTVFLIISSLIIYFKTRKMYKLTSHRGIRYFSLTFLFFALAYFFRFFFRFFFRLIMKVTGIFHPDRPGFNFGISLFIFASSLATLFLLYSVIWKNIGKDKDYSWAIYILAFLITYIDLKLRMLFFHIGILAIVFFIAAAVSMKKHYVEKKKNTASGMHTIYLMIFLFWIINILSIEIPRYMIWLNLFIYIISASMFMMILFRLFRKKK